MPEEGVLNPLSSLLINHNTAKEGGLILPAFEGARADHLIAAARQKSAAHRVCDHPVPDLYVDCWNPHIGLPEAPCHL
ncbi:MAG: hypothetical protein ACJARS_003681 [bacterium]|jgi:hypothetical protein